MLLERGDSHRSKGQGSKKKGAQKKKKDSNQISQRNALAAPFFSPEKEKRNWGKEKRADILIAPKKGWAKKKLWKGGKGRMKDSFSRTISNSERRRCCRGGKKITPNFSLKKAGEKKDGRSSSAG